MLLPEGGQLIATDVVPEVPVPMLGHVTSSYRSAALDRTFVPLADALVPVTVTDSVLFDKEGSRRDG